MALDFPNSPAVNDTYTIGNQTWKWTGSTWDLVASTVAGSANQVVYKDSANNLAGNAGFTYNGTDLSVGGKVQMTASSGDEGGEIFFAAPQTNTTITTGVTVDVYQNRLRIFEQGGTTRGYYVDVTAGAAGAGTRLAADAGAWTNYSSSVSFTNFAIGAGGTINYCKYAYLDSKTVIYTVKATLGTGFSVTGTMGVSLPVNAALFPASQGPVYFLKSGVGAYGGYTSVATTSRVDLGVWGTAGSYANGVGTSSTVPFTWAANDWFNFTMIYEVA